MTVGENGGKNTRFRERKIRRRIMKSCKGDHEEIKMSNYNYKGV